MDELEEQNFKHESDVDELHLILKDNEQNIVLMNRRLEEQECRELEMEQRIDSIAQTIDSEVKTNRSNEYGSLDYQRYSPPYPAN